MEVLPWFRPGSTRGFRLAPPVASYRNFPVKSLVTMCIGPAPRSASLRVLHQAVGKRVWPTLLSLPSPYLVAPPRLVADWLFFGANLKAPPFSVTSGSTRPVDSSPLLEQGKTATSTEAANLHWNFLVSLAGVASLT